MADEADGWLDRILHGHEEPIELCDELESSKVEIDGKVLLKHPYIGTHDYRPKHNAWYNDQFCEKRARAEHLKAQQKWWEYVDVHAQEYYPQILEEIRCCTTPVEWRDAVRSAWYLSDILWINREAWLRIFNDRLRTAGISTDSEQTYFNGLRDPLTVYRGCLPEHADGLSWSLRESAADHFKRKAGYRGVVFSGVVKKEHVLAYMNPNGEEYEIIVDPVHVLARQNLG